MEILDIIWQYVAPIFGSITFTTVFTFIINYLLKRSFSKALDKMNAEEIANKATDKGILKVKEIDFKHNIQPIVISELKKVTEEANVYIESQLKEVKEQYNKLLNVLEKLSAYFDNSIGVSDDTKAELRIALNDAKIAPTTPEISEVGEIIIEEPKQAQKTAQSASASVQGDR